LKGVTVHRLAEAEMLEAAAYYERERPRLGASFLDAVEECVKGVMDFPKAGRPLDDDVRQRHVTRFPYAVVYRASADGIRVLAVMHLRRRPFYWANRS
jgi:plasmid stabilization system protein ParE